MPVAYSYARFSSDKQKDGDSLRRQRDLALQFIERNPELELDLDTTLNLTDEGLSAYKGVAQTKGALGAFIRLVEDKQIASGSYLLVEALDRLSRQTPRQAFNQLNTLVDSGIVVVTLTDNKIYTREILDSDHGMSLIFAIMLMARAHEESVTKGQRIKAAWSNKFAKIKDGVQLTARVPFWINKEDKSKSIPDKVAIVKEIFEMSAKGIGAMRIAQDLNANKRPTPSKQSKKWAISSVKKVLASEAVLGTLVTSDGGKHEKYYPAIIGQRLWSKSRITSQSSKTARSTVDVHPLSGLMFCKSCGATAQRSGKTGRVRQDGTKNSWKTLVCAKSVSHASKCEYRSISYDKILHSVIIGLDQMAEFSPQDEIGKQIHTKRSRVEQLQDLIDLVTAPTDGRPVKVTATAKANLSKMFVELDGLRKEIDELVEIRRPMNQRLIEGARKAILKGEVNNALMRQAIKRSEIDFKKALLDIYGHDGSAISGLVLKDSEQREKDEAKRAYTSVRR
ncbi:recombinase family protein [Polynucleobacter sp. Latsch14-2]|jgi:DNA invertase Pin-like site-specific DNA recombinase|uniref:recombinase family protein n=1 Tax=Polynucleobacter sp. Latsch14-2 TaxID=2576920 RepID=UPI001C0CB7E4|nr:recombinase family protein [Polynucleobacter sp. Latsch14-2]MBU3614764.1 recombinase family protein [Polynucleobacter sp. Latsch14-2]